MRNRFKWVQNADWRCVALPGSLPRSRSICLDFVLRATFMQELGHSDAAIQPVPHAHTLLVLFTWSAPPIPLLLQHFAPLLSLPRLPLTHSSSSPYLSLLSVSLQDPVHLQQLHFHSLATDSLQAGRPPRLDMQLK